jgi:general secretion pathway protein H
MLTGRDQVISESEGSIRFDPDGSSSGGRISIRGGGQLWTVGVDWLSGRVSVVHAAR